MVVVQAKTKATTKKTQFQKLEPPSILFSNHHLLIIYKPPGWHSVPNVHSSSNNNNIRSNNTNNNNHQSNSFQKCILTKLKQDQLGGGSQGKFLLPLHRIDQPCSGILLFAKNSKAAKRIHKPWREGHVHKEYLCWVETNSQLMELDNYSNINDLHQSKSKISETSKTSSMMVWHELCGIFHPISPKQRTVIVSPLPSTLGSEYTHFNTNTTENGRICHIRYQILPTSLQNQNNPNNGIPYSLLRVVTSSGARHQIRAMLSQLLGTPIAGDLRYGATHGSLPDQSVALHAWKLVLPHTIQLAGMDQLLKEKEQSLVAPIPPTWKRFFGLDDNHHFNLNS